MGIFDWMYKDENEVEVKEQKQTINNIISQEDEEAKAQLGARHHSGDRQPEAGARPSRAALMEK